MKTFLLGQITATPGAIQELEKASIHPLILIDRHSRLDPGCLDAEDQARNNQSVQDGSRIFSAYEYNGVKFWVITEAGRHATTILLPDEY